MKNLTYLSLRNALINGSIPPYIGKYKSLQTLDLSFNNLSGQIPSALFSIDPLTQLFLGNNSLSGELPQQKGVKLQTTNLMGNNFTFDSSNISDFYGLYCLQRYFPCTRNAPRSRDSHIAINSGGKKLEKYEADDSDIGEASFVVLNSEKGAISNVGFLFTEGGQAFSTLAQNSGTKGTRRWKDFDISKEAGGVRRAIRMSFNPNVSENRLEIHLFWAGKGTCCIPGDGSYGPLMSALSVTPGKLCDFFES
ncbi:hypothetical protein Pint_11547 [Pistacia integerrima]|uniref:Uncharacterized protein n=1 Tax=Pistacia integerrima TaxID=434235 RepID=A0ACC0XFL1_9ROSI|nr:hypothetical protein Pint_11547 [Pistacia integerrima]